MSARKIGLLLIAVAMTMAAVADLAYGVTVVTAGRESHFEWRCGIPHEQDSEIEFCYRDDDYTKVQIIGSFNDWEPESMRLDDESDLWSIAIDLDEGRHLYQFVVLDSTDTWDAIDPNNPETERLDKRGWVSVIVIDEDGLPAHMRHSVRQIARHEFANAHESEDVDVLYNRVDGMLLSATPERLGKERFEPSVRGLIGYGFKSEEWSAGVTILQPLIPDGRLMLRAAGYMRTDYTDQTGIETDENSLAAFFFRKDFRDYYRREGASFSLVFREQDWLRLEGGFRADDYESMEQNANWSVWGDRFPWNPPIDEGTMRSFFAHARLGPKWNRLDVEYEQCGDDLFGGGFEFQKVTAQMRSRIPMHDQHHFDFRLRVAANLSGDLPAQKRYIAGGLGTVRGYNYRSLRIDDPEVEHDAFSPLGGEQLVLANVEYALELEPEIALIPFFDAGMVWESRQMDLDLDDLATSAGVGLRFGNDFRINLIRRLDKGDQDLVAQIRIERMF